MNNVTLHIEFLLQHHLCLVLPGLGALVVREVAAEYVSESQTFYPPRREVSFNPDLVENDGLLVNSVARARGIGYSLAAAIVEDEIAAMRRQLAHDGSVALGRVGQLSLDSEGCVLFQPFDSMIVAPALRWLRPLEISTVAMREEVRKVALTPDIEAYLADVARRRRFARTRSVAVAAASVVIAAGVGVSVIDIPERNEPDTSRASLAVEAPVMTLRRAVGNIAPVLRLRNHADAVTVVDTVRVAEAPRFMDSGRYCLVVASLASEDEARLFIRRNPGLTLGLLTADGRYRVYATSADSPAEVLQAARDGGLMARFPSSWVCRR